MLVMPWKTTVDREEERSPNHLLDDMTSHVGQAKLSTLEAVGELQVIQAEKLKDGSLDIMNVEPIFRGAEAELVGGAHGDPGFGAAAGEPHGVGVDVMVPANAFSAFPHGRAAEFSTPYDQRRIEKASRFQVGDESSLTAIHIAADVFEVPTQSFTGTAVMVPARVVKLHEADAALDQPAGQEAVGREAGLAWLDAVECERLPGFSRNVNQAWSTGLHAVGQLVLADARADFRIARLLLP